MTTESGFPKDTEFDYLKSFLVGIQVFVSLETPAGLSVIHGSSWILDPVILAVPHGTESDL